MLDNPNRPDHPDMVRLIDIILRLDGQATEGGQDVAQIAAEDGVDLHSLAYAAMQRAMRGARHTGIKDQRTEIAMSALWLEGFIVGQRFAKMTR